MAIVMTADELVKRLKNIVNNYKTIYVYGSIGGIVTNSLINQKAKQYPSFYTAARTARIRAKVGQGYFGFDCVNVIKSVLWGWNGNKNASYGGAKYASNGVPDVSADGMISLCKSVSSSGWNNLKIGEAVWLPGHIGVYIGNGLVIECTPKWNNCVQISGLGNVGKSYNGRTRSWKKHGKIPYVSYSSSSSSTITNESTDTLNITMQTTTNVNFRTEPNTSSPIIQIVPTGSKVTVVSKYSSSWYKVKFNGNTGYLYSTYLKEVSETTNESTTLNIVMQTTGNVNFRTEPNTSCVIIQTLLTGTKVTAISKYSDNWYKVKYNNKTGYVSAKYLEKVEEKVTVSGYIITKKTISLRKTADWNGTSCGDFPPNTKFTVTEKILLPKGGETPMYKTKSGYYITASESYVTFYAN